MSGILMSKPSPVRLITVWAVLGFVLAVATWVAFVVAASGDLRETTGDATVTKGVAGLEFVTASREQVDGASAVSLQTHAGAAILLVFPAMGAWMGVRTARRKTSVEA